MKIGLLLLSQFVSAVVTYLAWDLLLYLHPLVIAVLWVITTITTLAIGFLIFNIRISLPYNWFLASLIIYFLSLLVLLFFRPNDQGYQSWNLIPFSTIIFYFSGQVSPIIAFYNLAANVGLFLPFGFFFRIKQIKPVLLALYSIIAILIIEGTQFVTRRGSFDIDDLILNLTGIIIGFLSYPILEKIVQIRA